MADKNFKRTTDATAQFFSEAEKPVEKKEVLPAPKLKVPDTPIVIPKGYKLVKESKSERLQLLVTPPVKKALKDIAKKQKKSLNELCGEIFEDFIEAQGTQT